MPVATGESVAEVCYFVEAMRCQLFFRCGIATHTTKGIDLEKRTDSIRLHRFNCDACARIIIDDFPP